MTSIPSILSTTLYLYSIPSQMPNPIPSSSLLFYNTYTPVPYLLLSNTLNRNSYPFKGQTEPLFSSITIWFSSMTIWNSIPNPVKDPISILKYPSSPEISKWQPSFFQTPLLCYYLFWRNPVNSINLHIFLSCLSTLFFPWPHLSITQLNDCPRGYSNPLIPNPISTSPLYFHSASPLPVFYSNAFNPLCTAITSIEGAYSLEWMKTLIEKVIGTWDWDARGEGFLMRVVQLALIFV